MSSCVASASWPPTRSTSRGSRGSHEKGCTTSCLALVRRHSDAGFHPWYSHTLSLEDPAPEKRAHYTALFGEGDAETCALYDALPAPRPLRDALAEVEAHLEEFPGALLGEVGLDRSFRLPDPRADAPHKLTRLQTPIAHQRTVLRAQVDIACKLRRSVSMHSVRAAGQTTDFLAEMATEPSFKIIRTCVS